MTDVSKASSDTSGESLAARIKLATNGACTALGSDFR
jgi:hypothetical protein